MRAQATCTAEAAVARCHMILGMNGSKLAQCSYDAQNNMLFVVFTAIH